MSKNKIDTIFGIFYDIRNFETVDKDKKLLSQSDDKNPNELGIGEVRGLRLENKSYAAKLIKSTGKEYYIEKLRGPNIIKTYKILENSYKNEKYNLFVMEKASLRSLNKMKEKIHNEQIFRYINSPFSDISGNNLTKYFARQIIKGLELLERNELVHYGIKVENILICSKLILKISNFSTIINLKEKGNEKFKIPEIINRYVTPEYFKEEKEIDNIVSKKQDYFALGYTLFLLKVGYHMMTYKKESEDKLSEDRIIDLLQRDMARIRSNPLFNKEFVEFVCSLIAYVPEERPSFEEIYRNKWLNENIEDIVKVNRAFSEINEYKLLYEFIKSDYIFERQREIESKKPKKRSNFKFVKRKKKT